MAFQKISKFLQKIFGSRNERLLKVYWRVVEQVNELEPEYRQMPDSELGEITSVLKGQLEGGASQFDILGDAFAAVREASDRHLGIRNVFVEENEFDTADPNLLRPADIDRLSVFYPVNSEPEIKERKVISKERKRSDIVDDNKQDCIRIIGARQNNLKKS